MAPGNLSPRIALRTRPSAIAIAVAGAMAAAAPSSFALPTGGKVAAGEAAIFESSPTSLQITQSTHKAILNWQGFSIAGNESVNFSQPSASSVALNRVLGNNPSEIFGRLTANGQIFLSNPNGVLFGRGASVDVGGLVATTLSITDSDFLSGNYVFSNAGAAGSVINEGSIVTANGYTALIGPQVSNSGVIAARLGSVALAAADRVSLDMVGDGLISVSLDQAAVNAAAVNSGTITADGGHVLLTARSANALLDTVVNNSGVIRANSLVERNGEIVLDGGGAGSVVHSGNLQAAGVDSGTTGGSVRVLGDNVRLASGSRIDASGDAGGGTVLVGGDFQGKNPSIRNASFTTVEEGASIDVSAITSGNGGRAIVWADKTTTFDGHISARGGALSGNGGFVEVSGKQNLDLGGLVGHFDLSAPNGEGGNLLLDPNKIEIVAGTTGFVGPNHAEGAGTTQIGADDITGLLDAGTNVTLSTTDTSSQDDDIDVQSAVSWAGAGDLHLDAGDEVLGAGLVNPTGTGAFTFTQGDVDLIFTVDTGQGKIYNAGGADPSITAVQSGVFADPGDALSGAVGRTAGENVGLYAYNTGTLSVDSAGGSGRAYEIHLVTSDSFAITPAPLSINAATDTKVYDATTSSTGVVTFVGLQGADTVTGATQSFVSKNVLGLNGSTLQVDAGYTVNDGNGGGNYSITENTASGTITAAALSINAVSDTKVYDATTSSAGVVAFVGLQGADNVTGATQSFQSKDVLGLNGSTLQVDAGYTVNDGNGGGNYNITENTASGTITAAPLSINAVSDTKVYDATTSSAGVVAFVGLQGADTVTGATQSFQSKDVLGLNNSTLEVNAGYTVNDGNGGANYAVTENTASGTITPLAVALTAPSVTKVYDGGTSYAATSGNLTTIGGPLIGTDTLTSATIVYASKDVGTNKTVNFAAATIDDGNGGNNYSVTLNGNSTSTITRLNSVTWTGGGDGINWSDAGNWGGAIPDLANVANVNLGGANVTFTSSVGAIQIDNVSGGRLTFSSGTMDVANNATLTGYTQAAGTMDISGNLAITSTTAVTQTGGALIVGGTSSINSGANAISLTGSNDFVGTVTLDNTSGAAQITDANAITIGSSTLAGSLTVNSGGLITVASVTTGGTQQYNNNVRLGGAYTTNGGAFNVTGATAVASSSSISTGAGNVSLAGAVNGPGALTINSGGTTTFGSSIGQTTALASVTTDAAGTTNLGGNVRTSGAISFQDATSAATRTLQSTGNSSIRINAADSPAIISTSGSVTLGGTAHGSSGTPLSFTKTPSSLTLTQVSTSFFTGPTIPSTLTFQPGSSVTYNGVLIAASIAQQQAQQASSAAQGSAAAATVQEANETFGTDSVAEQVEYGFAGDVGTTPPMDHRLEETGISVPRCLEESREGLACK